MKLELPAALKASLAISSPESLRYSFYHFLKFPRPQRPESRVVAGVGWIVSSRDNFSKLKTPHCLFHRPQPFSY